MARKPLIYKRYNFNPLSPCGERLAGAKVILKELSISIHSPHAGRDGRYLQILADYQRISIHSPRVGRDFPDSGRSRSRRNFNPLSPCGERPMCYQLQFRLFYFNPLSPCGERPGAEEILHSAAIFQSTLPVWGETENTYSFSARKAVIFAQHRSKFGSREFFPAGEDWLFQRNTEFFSCEPDRKGMGASASHRI